METCTAAVFVESLAPLEIQELAVPEVADGGLLVRMQMAAVCGSDIHAWQDPRTKGPLIFGHENVGTVARLGGELTDARGEVLHEGDRVVFRPAPCGRCADCLLSRPCRVSGHIGFSPPSFLRGGFAQYLHLDRAPWVLKVPEDLSTERALLAVVGNHYAILGLERIGGVRAGETVVVQGAGPLGMGNLLQSQVAGAGRVILVGGPANRLTLGTEMGADDVVSLDDHPSPASRVERVLELTGGNGADLVIECSGAPAAVQEGLEMVRAGGRFLVLGQYTDEGPQPINPSLLTRKAVRVEGVLNGVAPFTYIMQSLEVMRTLPQPVERLITHRYGLGDVNEAFGAHESYEAMIPVLLPNG